MFITPPFNSAMHSSAPAPCKGGVTNIRPPPPYNCNLSDAYTTSICPSNSISPSSMYSPCPVLAHFKPFPYQIYLCWLRSLLTQHERPRTKCHLERRVVDLSNYSPKGTIMAAKSPNIMRLVQTDEGMSSSAWDFDRHTRGYTQLLTGFCGNADKMPEKRR
jgi:hypothetical protein